MAPHHVRPRVGIGQFPQLTILPRSCRGLSQTVDHERPFQSPYFGKIRSQPVARHLHRHGRRQVGSKLTDFSPDIHQKRGCLFQITYAKASKWSIEDSAASIWPAGSLYPGGLYRSMEYQSITVRHYHVRYNSVDISHAMQIDSVSDQLKETEQRVQRRRPDKYWTILFMEPSSWYDDLEDTLRTAVAENSSMQAACLVLVGYALHIATVEWQKMAFYFDSLLGSSPINDEDSTFLSPPKHDRLLFEDESFSRSRKYFWVIDALTRFMDEIEETQDVWKRYRVHEVDPFLDTGDWKDLPRQLEKAKDEVAKLEVVRRRLEKHLERTKVLRDGVR